MFLISLWHPELIVMIILLGWLYRYATTLDQKGTSSGCSRHCIYFFMWLVVFYVALGSPVAYLAQNSSFPIFVVQMLCMTLVMPWLLHASISTSMWSFIFQVKLVHTCFRILTRPVTAIFTYNALAALFLLPRVFDANLHFNWLHIVDQGVLMVSAVFFWWPLVNNSTEFPRLSKGFQLVYILFGGNFMMPIPVLLLVAQRSWYNTYLPSASHSDLDLVLGQQLGALFMIIGMGFVYGLLAFTRFLSYEGRTWYE